MYVLQMHSNYELQVKCPDTWVYTYNLIICDNESHLCSCLVNLSFTSGLVCLSVTLSGLWVCTVYLPFLYLPFI